MNLKYLKNFVTAKRIILAFSVMLFWSKSAYSACETTATDLTIEISGDAKLSTTPEYYVVRIPADAADPDVSVIIKAGGKTPCPTSAEECKCPKTGASTPPAEKGAIKYTFACQKGAVDPGDATKWKWTITSGETPGEYTFQVTKAEQEYESCPTGKTGGVTGSKINTRASKLIKILAFKIETEASANKPTDKKRKKLGVGEIVDLKLLPSTALGTWSVAGGATFGSCVPTTESNAVVFTAPAVKNTSIVKCMVKGVRFDTTYTVVEPDVVKLSRVSTTGPFATEPAFTPGEKGAGMNLLYEVLPLDVSFYFVSFKEVSGGASGATGIFATSAPYHTAHAYERLTEDNKIDDTAFAGRPSSPWTATGSFTHSIPVRWKLTTQPDSVQKALPSSTQYFEVKNSGTTSYISKQNSTAYAKCEHTRADNDN